MTHAPTLAWVTATTIVLAVLAAAAGAAQPARPAGPTRIAIAAGTVTDEQSRLGLVGTWEPDADLGTPPGANQATYFEDGLYFTPIRNITLVGLWQATARTLTLTPLEIRNLASAAPVPEMKEVFAQIAWDRPGTSALTWRDPDRYQESGSQFGRRRVAPARDLGALHLAALTDLVIGSWADGADRQVGFRPDGVYEEWVMGRDDRLTIGRGRYQFDRATGGLQVTIEGVESKGPPPALPGPTMGARAAVSLRVVSRGALVIGGVTWARQLRLERGAGGVIR
ncbi:MAG: hypothetical protein AB7U83_16390 [Vicinamibacterales bacterium]